MPRVAESARGKVEIGTPAPRGAETADGVRTNANGQKVLSEVKAGKSKNIGKNITKASAQLDRDITARQAAGEHVSSRGRIVIEGQPGQHVDEVASQAQRHVPSEYTPKNAPPGTVVRTRGAVGSANHDIIAQDDQGRQKLVREGDGPGADPRSKARAPVAEPRKLKYSNTLDAMNGHANRALDAIDRVGARIDHAMHVASDASGITKANQKIANGLLSGGRKLANTRAGKNFAAGAGRVYSGAANSRPVRAVKNRVKNPNRVRVGANGVKSPTAKTLARGGGKLLGPAAVAYDVYNVNNAYQADLESGDGNFTETKKAVGEAAGGWAGASSGAAIGATVGSVIPVAGTAVGAVVGGIIGGLGGSYLGRTVGGWF